MFITGNAYRRNLRGWTVRKCFRSCDVENIINLHAIVYFKEYGYDKEFKAYVAEGLYEFAKGFKSDSEGFWIVEMNGQIIGFIAVIRHSSKEAQLRWFIVHPSHRGKGIGKYLLDEALKFCRNKYEQVFLWTTSELEAAHHLYISAGFRKTKENTHLIWSKKVTEEKYELLMKDLTKESR
jgi:ribosomal protein S18 acetylase RimI-like enzyme